MKIQPRPIGNHHAYRVIYRGKLLSDQDAIEVRSRLRSRFDMSELQLDAFFSGTKFTVKQNLTERKAIQLHTLLRDVGLDVVTNKMSFDRLASKAKVSAESRPATRKNEQLDTIDKRPKPAAHRNLSKSFGQSKPEKYDPNKAVDHEKNRAGVHRSKILTTSLGVIFAALMVGLFFLL